MLPQWVGQKIEARAGFIVLLLTPLSWVTLGKLLPWQVTSLLCEQG